MKRGAVGTVTDVYRRRTQREHPVEIRVMRPRASLGDLGPPEAGRGREPCYPHRCQREQVLQILRF